MIIKLKLFSLIFVILAFTACKSTSKIKKANPSYKSSSGFYNRFSQKFGYSLQGSEEKKFIEAVGAWLGVPYKYGGCGKNGTDCSCFVSSFFKDVYGISLPRKSEDMKLQTKIVEKNNLKLGDLVFFKINEEKVSHVGIYISKDYFVHATTSKGVMINNLNENYYIKYYLSAGRIER